MVREEALDILKLDKVKNKINDAHLPSSKEGFI